MIVIPPLEYPETVFIKVRPAAVAEVTMTHRVWALTGIDRPVTIPLLMEPNEIIPVSGGVNVTAVPGTGENVLSGVAEQYN